MGVYIPDLRLPADGDFELWIAVRKDGSFTYNVRGGWQDGKQKAVPVPPHGRLGDLDAAVEKLKKLREYHLDDSQSGVFIAAGISQCIEVLTGKDAPTIIEAEEGEA